MFVIYKILVCYDSITKKKHQKKMYFSYIDENTDTVHWIGRKKSAKIYSSIEQAKNVATEIYGNVEEVKEK